MADGDNNTDWTVAELAYLAGIIDGEGSFCIARSYAKEEGAKPRRFHHYIPHLKVCNTDLDLILWIHERFGGRINNTRPKTERWNTLYCLRWNCKKAERVTKAVYPYLRVKKLHATVLLEMLGRMGKHSFRGIALSRHERDVRAMLRDLMGFLNLKGRKDLPPIDIDADRLSERTTEVLRLVRQSDLAGNEPQETGRNDQSAQASA